MNIALLVIAAQLASIALPRPAAPVWIAIDAAREISAASHCPGHAVVERAPAQRPLPFAVFRCPCGCGDGPAAATGTHHSRVALIPPRLEYRALQQARAVSSEPPRFAPQLVSSRIKHVPRAA